MGFCVCTGVAGAQAAASQGLEFWGLEFWSLEAGATGQGSGVKGTPYLLQGFAGPARDNYTQGHRPHFQMCCKPSGCTGGPGGRLPGLPSGCLTM